MLYENYPSLDLHGCDREYATILVNDFIRDNVKLGKRYIKIIHGKGTGVLRTHISQLLKKKKEVEKYYFNMFNDGETIVELKK